MGILAKLIGIKFQTLTFSLIRVRAKIGLRQDYKEEDKKVAVLAVLCFGSVEKQS